MSEHFSRLDSIYEENKNDQLSDRVNHISKKLLKHLKISNRQRAKVAYRCEWNIFSTGKNKWGGRWNRSKVIKELSMHIEKKSTLTEQFMHNFFQFHFQVFKIIYWIAIVSYFFLFHLIYQVYDIYTSIFWYYKFLLLVNKNQWLLSSKYMFKWDILANIT